MEGKAGQSSDRDAETGREGTDGEGVRGRVTTKRTGGAQSDLGRGTGTSGTRVATVETEDL